MVTEVKRRISKKTYFAVFSFTVMIFLIGVLVGWQFSKSKILLYEEGYNNLDASLIGIDLKEKILEEQDICKLSLTNLWQERNDLGQEISRLENRLGKENKDVLMQKEYYQLVEIRTLLLLERFKKECDPAHVIIIYFYTNKDKDIKGSSDECERQGYVLDDLYKRNEGDVSIFSFDINTDNPAINTLKEIYSIEKVPAIVLNGKAYNGFKSLYELRQLTGLR